MGTTSFAQIISDELRHIIMADEGNSTVGLLNGIAKREYYGSTDITNEFLKEELFPNLSLEEFTAVYTKCSHLLKVKINFITIAFIN